MEKTLRLTGFTDGDTYMDRKRALEATRNQRVTIPRGQLPKEEFLGIHQ